LKWKKIIDDPYRSPQSLDFLNREINGLPPTVPSVAGNLPWYVSCVYDTTGLLWHRNPLTVIAGCLSAYVREEALSA